MTPRETLQSHRERPRNMGRMGDAHAIGNVGSIVVGRALRLFVSVVDGRIAAVRFQSFACPAQLAPTSVLSEIAVGRTIEEAEELDAPDVCEALGGLPRRDLPPICWGAEALRDALRRFREAPPPAYDERRFASPLVCRCEGVEEQRLRELIDEEGIEDVAELRERSRAGTVCATCRPEVDAVLRDALESPPAPAPGAAEAAPRESRLALLGKIQAASHEVLAGYRERGVSIELWDLEEREVRVRASGDDDLAEEARDRLQAVLQDEVEPSLSVVLL